MGRSIEDVPATYVCCVTVPPVNSTCCQNAYLPETATWRHEIHLCQTPTDSFRLTQIHSTMLSDSQSARQPAKREKNTRHNLRVSSRSIVFQPTMCQVSMPAHACMTHQPCCSACTAGDYKYGWHAVPRQYNPSDFASDPHGRQQRQSTSKGEAVPAHPHHGLGSGSSANTRRGTSSSSSSYVDAGHQVRL